MTNPKPIAKTCRLYIETVYPGVTLDPVQRQEIERAYYAGALYWAEILEAVSKVMDEQEAAKCLYEFHKELKAFGESIGSTGSIPLRATKRPRWDRN